VRSLDPKITAGPQWREYAQIADRIARDAPRHVLDWGCGNGQVSHLLTERGLSVQAYDYRPGEPPGPVTLEHFPHVTAEFGDDPVAVPYATGAFDAVLSCGVLEHVEDPDASLDELRRVLQPGGRLYVYKLPNRRSYLEAVAKHSGRLYYHGQLEHDRVYSCRGAKALLEAHGFRVTELRLANMLPLTVPLHGRLADALWLGNTWIARVPGVRAAATNVEAVAAR
jgi:2-polyprenyl-3-methyl-5-hydroxy-6-metoxy-1,4-benzoquinol methylase